MRVCSPLGLVGPHQSEAQQSGGGSLPLLASPISSRDRLETETFLNGGNELICGDGLFGYAM